MAVKAYLDELYLTAMFFRNHQTGTDPLFLNGNRHADIYLVKKNKCAARNP